MDTDLAITPKRLGLIEIDSFCPRCYWYLLKQKFHPPFDHFGGAIFKSMEQAQMAVVGDLIEKNGGLPEEFAPFCDLVGRVQFPRNWRKFKHRLDSGVLLYGEPDDIFQVSDGSIAVIDFKTARPKDGKDPLLGCYRIQILGYSFIAEFGLKLGEVSRGGLFYWGAEHEKVVADPDKYYRSKKFPRLGRSHKNLKKKNKIKFYLRNTDQIFSNIFELLDQILVNKHTLKLLKHACN